VTNCCRLSWTSTIRHLTEHHYDFISHITSSSRRMAPYTFYDTSHTNPSSRVLLVFCAM